MAVDNPSSLEDAAQHLQHLLDRATTLKRGSTVEPPLPASEFTGSKGFNRPSSETEKTSQYAQIELAARKIFHGYVSVLDVREPEFVNVWNLLDILSICGDQEQCDPVLVWWLVEELLESQSIESCRTVFDYLDSRRERLVTRHFRGKKELVILRTFNELLRRLSRAEDAVFCGRVLIFLSQSSQLGARSATNHKGEFNLENVTTFEESLPGPQEDIELPDAPPVESTTSTTPVVHEVQQPPSTTTTEKEQKENAQSPPVLDSDVLYPIFWSLQRAFSNPPLVFEPDNMTDFQKGLDSTLRKFKQVPKVIETSRADSTVGSKRSRYERESSSDFVSTFNPKYLTSTDLFKLELSDLTFQRDILVQALILIDFLLSLSEKAKKKPSYLQAQNKAVQYAFTLTDHDEEWLSKIKGSIAIYLREGPEGTYFYRMVDTVLSRDKNWVRWKLDNCPDIRRDSITPDAHKAAHENSKKLSAPRRLRSAPVGSLNLGFLTDKPHDSGLRRLTNASKSFPKPSLATLANAVRATELDLEMASGEEEEHLRSLRETQLWGVLRDGVKSKNSFARMTKVATTKDLDHLLATDLEEEDIIATTFDIDGVEEATSETGNNEDSTGVNES